MNNKSWSYFPGANVSTEGVIFAPVDRKIVNQDGSGGQPDPAVNVGGQYLSFNGDFDLQLIMSRVKTGQSQSFRLYSRLPVIYDEWRLEVPSVDLEFKDHKVIIHTYNGNQEKPEDSVFEIADSGDISLTLLRRGNKLSLLQTDKLVAELETPELFSTKAIWFGASGSNAWTLKELTVNSIKHSAVFKDVLPLESYKADSSSLANLMSKIGDKKIGTAVSLYPLLTDRSYQKLASTQFNQWTTENELKAQFVHPGETQYQFGPTDLLVRVASQYGITVHGHALVFGEANPAWMQNTPKDKLADVMTNHITNIVSRYKDSISEWDVINEPLSDDDADYANGGNGLRRHIWYNAMGDGYIAAALNAARAANPDAKLYINEYGLEEDGPRWDTMLKLVKKLKVQQIPIDGVGFQSHVYETTDHEETEVIVRHMKQLQELGLSARISEIDVHGEDQVVQTAQYSAVLKACLAVPNCTSFTTWGITDAYGSTTSDHTYPPEYGDDLLWDEAYKPKQAQLDLVTILKSSISN